MRGEPATKILQDKLSKHRPTLLLLGQSYLGKSPVRNAFVNGVSEHFQIDFQSKVYALDQLAEKLDKSDLSAELRYLHRRSESVPITQELHEISEFAWSNVFTSAIDEVWIRAFKKPWRSLRSVFTEKTWPLEARDPNQLCSSFLFGCVDKEDEDCRIPTGPFVLDERRHTAVALLRRLPEIATPIGILLIEGYDPANDWLRSQDLYPVLNSMAPGQVFLFSADESVQGDRYLSRLASDGKILFVDSALSGFLRNATEAGVINFGDPAVKLPTGRQITIESVPHAIPRGYWQNLSGIASILDDNLVMPPTTLTGDLQYMDYRNFLADPVRPNDWSGFGRGYVFQRDFEHQLRAECEKRLKQKRLQLNPLLLHGESGTGKTIAMANIAYHVASQCLYPVLFIDRAISNPDWKPLDRFLNWAEDSGASACLLMWDGMRTDDQYQSLQRRLADRGRKVLLVGSTYHSSKPTAHHVEAPRELNAHEKVQFMVYLKRFVPDLEKGIETAKIRIDPAFLVALYRILPSTRPRLAKGITGEMEYAGKDILERIKATENREAEFNSLAVAFESIPFFQQGATIVEPMGNGVDNGVESSVRDLIALVMVPGKYGFKVPIELLLSALGKDINSATLSALKTEVLVWSEQSGGDILVGPRHPLEAKMYIDTYFGNAPEAEAELIRRLILGLRRGGNSDGHVNFIVDLLKDIGPNSTIQRNRNYFINNVMRLAEALTILRTERSFLSPRLMLQEGNFRRESVRINEEAFSPEQRLEILKSAEEVLMSAKAHSNCPDALKSSVNAELAACYGAMIHTIVKHKVSSPEVIALFDHARLALREATRRNWANAHALVTLGWISRSILGSSAFTEVQRAEIQAELLSQFDDAVPSNYDSIQLDYYLKEKIRVMEALGQSDLAQLAFEELRRSGSKAGYFLRARSMFGDFPEQPATEDDLAGMRSAEDYLQTNWNEIKNDERCLGLYLNVWWFVRTREARFARERQVLPFTKAEWTRLEMVSTCLKTLKDPDPPAWLRVIVALSRFHCGNVSDSIREFREISNDPNVLVGGKRLIKYFIASENGQPFLYDGTARQHTEESRIGEIWVNQLHYGVPVIPRDFDRQKLEKNESINNFCIAFSFTGPIAQPAHLLRTNKPAYGR
jgi:hypothetical protein